MLAVQYTYTLEFQLRYLSVHVYTKSTWHVEVDLWMVFCTLYEDQRTFWTSLIRTQIMTKKVCKENRTLVTVFPFYKLIFNAYFNVKNYPYLRARIFYKDVYYLGFLSMFSYESPNKRKHNYVAHKVITNANFEPIILFSRARLPNTYESFFFYHKNLWLYFVFRFLHTVNNLFHQAK